MQVVDATRLVAGDGCPVQKEPAPRLAVDQAVGAHAAGKMSDEDLHELEGVASPGAGACGGQFTANTMAMVLTFLGLSPLGANDIPATDPAKADAGYACGELAMALLRDRGVLAWTGYHAGHFTVKAADIANGTLRPAQNLSPPPLGRSHTATP